MGFETRFENGERVNVVVTWKLPSNIIKMTVYTVMFKLSFYIIKLIFCSYLFFWFARSHSFCLEWNPVQCAMHQEVVTGEGGAKDSCHNTGVRYFPMCNQSKLMSGCWYTSSRAERPLVFILFQWWVERIPGWTVEITVDPPLQPLHTWTWEGGFHSPSLRQTL